LNRNADSGNMPVSKTQVTFMANRRIHAAWSAPICLSLLLSACGGASLNPFGKDGDQVQSRTPPNSTEYQCNGNKRFYVRYLDNGSTAWLIYPDREVNLTKSSGPGTRYSNGVAVLDVNNGEATLTDGPAISYNGCKAIANSNK
jgi:membrane-bound inhibitor of C-type lysozyme